MARVTVRIAVEVEARYRGTKASQMMVTVYVVKAMCRVSLKPQGHLRVFTAYTTQSPGSTEWRWRRGVLEGRGKVAMDVRGPYR